MAAVCRNRTERSREIGPTPFRPDNMTPQYDRLVAGYELGMVDPEGIRLNRCLDGEENANHAYQEYCRWMNHWRSVSLGC